MHSEKLNIFSFSGRMKMLHLSWMAFFIAFFMWYSHAPLLNAIGESMGISMEDLKVLLIINVALTIPARVVMGMLTDKYGPRLVFPALLVICSVPCFMFALADNYTQLALARFFMGFVGAGFVVGIRMVSEWFPANELGTAEGIYGGWGNFGSAAAAIILPTVALMFGGENGWRYAVALTGMMSLIFAFIYYFNVRDTPKGSTYFKPKSVGAMEVTSRGDFFLLLLMKVPMYGALALLAWRLSPVQSDLLSDTVVTGIYIALILLYGVELSKVWAVNKSVFTQPVPELHRYKFRQVAVLNILYSVTFGSELAIIGMLPLFFAETFNLSPITAGLVASVFPFMNLIARPAGGFISDKVGRRSTLLVVITCMLIGYFVMGMIDSQWTIGAAVVVAMLCAFCAQSGSGAVFAAVPLIKRRLTGQIAGMTGAYGNVGALIYLTALTFVDYSTFFYVLAGAGVVGFITLLFMEEPRGHMAEVREDGSVELINVT